MSKDPAFPFYASDWLGSNKRAMMTMEQQAAYVILLCRQWTDPTCSLPDDDAILANLSGMGEGWLKGGCQLLRDCFPKIIGRPGRIGNPRLLDLRAERDEFLARSSEGGKKSQAIQKKRREDAIKVASSTLQTPLEPTLQANGKSSSPSPSSSSSSLPSASPLPSATPKAKAKPCRSVTDRTVDVKAVIAHYRTLHPQAQKKPSAKSKEWRGIECRLNEGYTIENLCDAIDGCHRTPHNMGENDSGQKWLGLELIMRNASQVDRFMEAPENAPVLTEQTRRNMRAAHNFINDDSIRGSE